MASDLSSIVPQSPSEERDRMGDAHSKDMDSGSNSPIMATNANESTNIIQSTIDDLVSTSEKDFPVTSSISREPSDEVGAIPTEKESVLFVKNSNDLPLTIEANVIDPILSEHTESTPVTQTLFSESIESSEGIQPSLLTESVSLQVAQLLEEIVSSEIIELDISEIESSQIIQTPLSEDIGYIQVNKAALDAETKLIEVRKSTDSREPEVIQTTISEGTASSTLIQPDLSEKTKSKKLINLVQSDEIESTEVIQSVILDEVNSNKEISIDSLESRCNKTGLFFSTDSRKDKVSSNEMDPSANPEIASKGSAEITKGDLNFPENSSSLSALDSESFLSLLNREEYKNATRILFPGSGRVLVTPAKPWEPIFPSFEMPSLSPHTKDPSNIPLMLTKDRVPKRKSSKRSMTTLLSMFVRWAQKGQGNLFNSSEKPKFKDFVDNSKKELKYGLHLLNQMDNHVEKIVRGVRGLPDPTLMLPRELGSERISVRDSLMDAGADLQGRIQRLEAEVAEDYDALVSLFCKENLNTGELENKQMEETAHDIVQDLFADVSSEFLTLGIFVEKYRDKIRDFCLVMDRFL